ncbi:MAG: hypothetical protein ACLU80_11390 [Dorea sp.]
MVGKTVNKSVDRALFEITRRFSILQDCVRRIMPLIKSCILSTK